MTAETSNARGEWVLVPREPTEAMLDAMHSRIRILCDPAARTAAIQNDREVWAAMLAAAPPAPVSVPLDRLTALDGLVDRIAEAIRDGAGLAEGDPPWERLGEERRAPWRADAKRALSVIKESLTAETRTPPPAAESVQPDPKAEARGVVDEDALRDARTIYDIACIRESRDNATREDVEFKAICLRNYNRIAALTEARNG